MYHDYVINGCNYHKKDHDDFRVTQNSGVSVVPTTMQIASSRDNNLMLGELCFYGIIIEVWELDYIMLRVLVFKCN